MYENYSRQSLPTKEYRELLGSALCVFSSNNGFIIENIINTDDSFNWYDLIDEIVLDPWVTRNQERAVKSFLSQLAHQQNQKTICCWKSHLNDYPQYLVPTLNI